MTIISDLANIYWNNYLTSDASRTPEMARQHGVSTVVYELSKYLDTLGKDTAAAELRALLSEEWIAEYEGWLFDEDVQDEEEADQPKLDLDAAE